MSGKDEATFKINIDGNAASASKEISTSARAAAKSIADYENEVKSLSADLRRLRGNTEDVVSAKKAVKAQIDAAKASASSLTAELIKQGTSYKAAAEAAKKYGDSTKTKVLPNLRGGLDKAFKAIGTKLAPMAKKMGSAVEPMTKAIGAKLGPMAATLSAKLAPVGKAFASVGKMAKEDFGSVASSVGPVLGELLVGAAALATAAFLALGAAIIAGGAALAAFSLATADAYAKMSRQREALLGTAKDAQALGDQIGVLAGKVPDGVAELNQMSLALSKTRISGKATVDALNAIAQVSGAVDASAGQKIQELITRNDKFGRMAIGMFELQGTGLDFSDVAEAYAKGTHKSLAAAQKELRMGIAPIEAGSKALRDAAEKKFGKLNLANAFSLENAPKKFMDQFRQLSAGIDLGPITKALQDAFGQLDPNAPLGAAVKEFMTVFGGGLVDIGAKAIPVLLEGFKWMIVFGLKIATVFVETKNKIADAFDRGDWFGIGKALVMGLLKGMLSYSNTLVAGVVDIANKVKDAFTGPKGIDSHSPSKVFQRYGEYTTEGYAQGIERGSRRATEATQGLAASARNGADGASSTTSASPLHLTVHIHGAPTGDAKAMGSPAFLSSLTQALRDSLTGRGLAPA